MIPDSWLAKLPPPKNDPTEYGWLKRYLIDWLVPTTITCIGVYIIAQRFISPFANIQKSDSKTLETMFSGIVKSFQITNSHWFHFAFLLVLIFAVGTSLVQYFKFQCKSPRIVRRSLHLTSPMAYWALSGATKMVTMIVTPLTLVLAAAITADQLSLAITAVIYLVALAIVIAPIHHLMYRGLHAPFLYTLKVAHHGNSPDLFPDPEQTANWLAETHDRIACLFGGVWTSVMVASQDGRSGLLCIGLPRPLDEYDDLKKQTFASLKEDEKKLWNGRRYSCEDFAENGKKRKQKT